MNNDFKEYIYENFYVTSHNDEVINIAVSKDLDKENLQEDIDSYGEFDYELTLEGEFNDQNNKWKITPN